MRRARNGIVLLLGFAGIFALSACGSAAYGTSSTGGNTNTGTAGVNCSTSDAPICTKSVQVNGADTTVLSTANGLTLYYFMPDTATTIACTGSCATTWPPLMSSSAPSGNFGLTGTVTAVTGANGSQLAYNGHPLYTYSADKAMADAKGEGVAGKWHVVTPDIAPLSGTSSGGGGGYNYGY
jgi:predicted lipoprotein with Yx(FWY)xxD motif